MRIVYFDCKNGISGDMAFGALKSLLDDEDESIFFGLEKLEFSETCHSGHFHVSYSEIKNLINGSGISENAKKKALSIYSVIAKAEASVHGTSVSEVHFHEVGRIEAVKNIVGAAVCADALKIGAIYCSEIHDGKGFVDCSHGTIPVPVPAVMAMRVECGLKFVDDENIKTEMVTPSGLGILLGLSASYSGGIPAGEILKKSVVFGKRETGKKNGLSVYLIEPEAG